MYIYSQKQSAQSLSNKDKSSQGQSIVDNNSLATRQRKLQQAIQISISNRTAIVQRKKIGEIKLERGTYLYHGTPYQSGPKWWRPSHDPNELIEDHNDYKKYLPKSVDKEDGGICFAQDPKKSPKTRGFSNKVLMRYRLLEDITVEEYESKGEFMAPLKRQAIVCTRAESEIRFPPESIKRLLEYVDDFDSEEKFNNRENPEKVMIEEKDTVKLNAKQVWEAEWDKWD